MQAGLVLGAFEICSPELVDCPIIPPNKTTDGELDEVSEENVSPEFASPDVLRREFHESCDIAVLVVEVASSNNAYGDENATANETENNEDVPDHPQESQKEDSVQANLVYELLLF